MAKGPDWNDVHRANPGTVRDALTEPDIPFDDATLAQPNGHGREKQIVLPSPPDRASLTISAWLDRDIPERDFLLGSVMCSTSRWFIYGETGIGKTLIAMEMAASIAVAAAFLKWPGQRRARVMYLDGELPMETFKERMELIADRHGKDIEFYGYNREDLGDEGMPPLNTEVGQAWLKREIAAIKPDLIIFDSIMCLLIGSMSEEATWMPVRPFVRWLSAQRIAQVWLHHANDLGKSFGDKTREWEEKEGCLTASGRLSVDPWKESRTHTDGGHVPVVCTWLWCDLRDAGAWIYLVAARPTIRAVLADLRKDDRITVSGEARALKVHKDDGKPFVELVIYSIVPWRHMTEADQGLAVH